MRRRSFSSPAKETRRFVWHPSGRYKVLSMQSRTPISWIGGKNYIAKWIIQHFPAHACYVEPFGGGASVLLQKVPSKVEIYNDVDGRLVEFFEVLKSEPWQLIAVLEHMPYSRLLYEGMIKVVRNGVWPKNKVEKVAMWTYMQSSTFAGKRLAGWGHGKTKSESKKLSRISEKLIEASNRLRDVEIECSDFRKIIKTYDSDDTLFYCDPPYFEAEHYYEGAFCMKDHENLAELLHNVKGKVCLSYSPHPKIDEFYAGWRRETKTVPCHSFGLTQATGKKTRPKRTELLLMNF